MATLAFAVAPLLIPGVSAGTTAFAVLGGIGAAIGSYIDNAFLMPLLAPKDSPNAELPDIQVSSEGGPVNFFIGQECKVTGQVIWMSPPRLIGGEASVDVAIAFTHFQTGMMPELKWMWARGHVLYNDSGTITLTTDELEIDAHNFSPDNAVITTTDPLVDLSVFIAGVPAQEGTAPPGGDASGLVMSGWSNSVNNITIGTNPALVVSSKIDELKIAIFAGSDFVDETASGDVTLTQYVPQSNPNFIDASGSGIVTYTGEGAQARSPLIESWENTSIPLGIQAFEGTTYITIEGLILTQFGTVLPEIIAVWDSHGSAIDLQEAVSAIMTWRGWDNTDTTGKKFDVSNLDDSIIVRGYSWRGVPTTAAVLEPLMIAYDFVAQDREGVLTFIHKSDLPIFEIPEEDLGAHSENGDNSPVPFEIFRDNRVKLPTKVTIEFDNAEDQYQPGSVERKRNRQDTIHSNELHHKLPLTLTPDDARAIATRLLWDPYQSNLRANGQLPPKYIYLSENDILRLPKGGWQYDVALTKVDRGANFMIAWEGTVIARRSLPA